MNVGKTLFAQIMEYVPWKTFGRIIDRHGGDTGVRTLSCADLFRVMAFAQLTWRESLRDIEVCLTANQAKLFHMGMRGVPARSTLADALNLRDWRIYHALAMRLIQRARSLYAKDSLNIDLDATVYALDATTIDLCLSLFDWAPFRTTKAAVKMHTLLDLRGSIPAFIHISDGKMHEVNVLDILPVEAGAFYVMDRGYLDFARLYKMHQAGAFFVTRSKNNTQFERRYSNPVDKTTGVLCDQIIFLTGVQTAEKYPDTLRRIKYRDAETGHVYVFLTNNFDISAYSVALLYKHRWQIELFFKWIKQHLKIKAFWGHSENAVKTQICIALCSYLIVAILKKQLRLEQNLYEILQITSASLFDKSSLVELFSDIEIQSPGEGFQKTLPLLGF